MYYLKNKNLKLIPGLIVTLIPNIRNSLNLKLFFYRKSKIGNSSLIKTYEVNYEKHAFHLFIKIKNIVNT